LPVRITIGGSSREWWTKAREAVDAGTAPVLLLPLLNGLEGEVILDPEEWRTVREWAQSFPGWAEADGQEQLASEFAGPD
jgi:hypothetical protein